MACCGYCQILETGFGYVYLFKPKATQVQEQEAQPSKSGYSTIPTPAASKAGVWPCLLLPLPHPPLRSCTFWWSMLTITQRYLLKHQATSLPQIHSDIGSCMERKATFPLLVPVALMSLPSGHQLPSLLLTHSCPTGCLVVIDAKASQL